MKICDICGQAVLDVDDFEVEGKTLDACDTCYQGWQQAKDILISESNARFREIRKEGLKQFLADKGYPHEHN